jgi:hypothetical protein
MLGQRLSSTIFAAILCSITAAGLDATKADMVPPDQGWSATQREAWYRVTQGSRLIPLDWLRALEQPTKEAPFLEASYIDGFRYLPDATDANGLPIGFAVDDSDDTNLSNTKLRWKPNQTSSEKWVGMTCSACHTSELTYKGNRIRVDGGPTLADFQSFIVAINDALVATRDDAEKWSRFAAKVLLAKDDAPNRETLRAALNQLIDWQLKITALNETPLKYGFGRLDAFGHIYNKVALLTGGPFPQRNPSDAPVSYPFLWNVPQHDKVQWNGIAPNAPTIDGLSDQPVSVGSLGRNVGEVIGVFGDVRVTSGAGLKGYTSSADVKELIALEQQLTKLLPPAWPTSVFGDINPTRKKEGKLVFDQRCASCHTPLARTDLTTAFKAKMFRLSGANPTGTDPWTACNAYTYTAKPGQLVGTKEGYFVGAKYGTTAAPMNKMLATVVAGALVGKKGQIISSSAASFFGINRPPHITPSAVALPPALAAIQPARSVEKQTRFNRCFQEDSSSLAYKARPLTGIWATAPFLHNGSVPTLYDLLLPPDQRPKKFFVGSREYDPKKVGFVTEKTDQNSFELNAFDDQGKLIDGNWNTGHDYDNATMSDDERWALVEYLKTL